MRIARWIAIITAAATVTLTCCQKKPSSSQKSAPLEHRTTTHAAPELALGKDEQSCKEFVQSFYDWYVSRELRGECKEFNKMEKKTHAQFSDPDIACKRASEFHSVRSMTLKLALSPELNRLLDEDAAAQAKDPGEITGLDGDPFLNGNGGAIYNYIVDSAHVTDGKCHAIVNETGINGNQEVEGKVYDRIALDLSRASNRWTIDNIHYRFEYSDETKRTEVWRDENLIQELNALGDK